MLESQVAQVMVGIGVVVLCRLSLANPVGTQGEVSLPPSRARRIPRVSR
jgi:hypothetical protein